MKAVIDRFEGNYAVILVGNEEVMVDVPIKFMPRGAKEGSWLKIVFELDSEGTEKQKEKISNLLDKLKSKNR